MAGRKKTHGGLKPEDAALWARVAETMDARMPDKPAPDDFRRLMQEAFKSKKISHAKSRDHKPAATPRKAPNVQAKPVHEAGATGPALTRERLRSSLPVPFSKPEEAPAGSGGTLDRRTRQRLLRGKVTIEARIDLHGLGVEEARMRLRGFIITSRQKGLRTVLVITGKGAAPFTRHTLHGHEHWHAPERQGILRRELPRWLSEPDMQAHVAGFQPAHPRHGGGGAFYVRLRRKHRGGG